MKNIIFNKKRRDAERRGKGSFILMGGERGKGAIDIDSFIKKILLLKKDHRAELSPYWARTAGPFSKSKGDEFHEENVCIFYAHRFFKYNGSF
ncbi:hypothetical protein X927_00185 [Petrotoga mexicana DSM 14811]|uniref:Uncharacterized protein n=1 Tax=Petrotoga mexicana DSM 14811 TaxID=1122954 RepID=A0A2K1PFY7_9BACT|nr:hypothetical protein X927_00185 [Petrotoga mexicana DSM 14811]